jgi:hypothetical protein
MINYIKIITINYIKNITRGGVARGRGHRHRASTAGERVAAMHHRQDPPPPLRLRSLRRRQRMGVAPAINGAVATKGRGRGHRADDGAIRRLGSVCRSGSDGGTADGGTPSPAAPSRHHHVDASRRSRRRGISSQQTSWAFSAGTIKNSRHERILQGLRRNW